MTDVIAECEKTGTEAEQDLIAKCRAGKPCILNGRRLPDKDAPTIRADLIRALALQATSLHEAGVWLEGAVITGRLDLNFAKCRGQLVLHSCRFLQEPQMTQTELAQLSLDGSHLPGLFAQGVVVTGSLFLSNATATGTVDVNSARIGGQLACEGATLNGDGGDALNGQSLIVTGGFLFRQVKAIADRVDLSSAHVGDLVDDTASCALCSDLILDGFTYDRIVGNTAPKSFAARKDWLKKGSRFEGEFAPQPYTQFAKVMRAAGHLGEARKALMARDCILFDEAEKADRAAHRTAYYGGDNFKGDSGRIWLRMRGRRLWSGLSRWVIGHGHHPEYALFWALAAVIFGAIWFTLAWAAGVMVPNSDVILTSADWLAAMDAAKIAPTPAWSALPSAKHYETFYALPYALDVFVPLVSLGQEQAWAASTVTWFGWATRWMSFGFQIGGWVVTSLGIAAITGFVQRNSPE